jgi:hypothetical protein
VMTRVLARDWPAGAFGATLLGVGQSDLDRLAKFSMDLD